MKDYGEMLPDVTMADCRAAVQHIPVRLSAATDLRPYGGDRGKVSTPTVTVNISAYEAGCSGGHVGRVADIKDFLREPQNQEESDDGPGNPAPLHRQ